jgi:hypothetical protein
MRPPAVLVGLLALAASLGIAAQAAAQNLVEVRLADSKYRYADWDYTFANGFVADAFYVGVPGSNEFNVGGGYAIKRGPVVLTPLVYAVFGKEDSQAGIKVALLASFEKRGWKAVAFVGDYIPVSGGVDAYQVLDTLDVTRVFAGCWEAGVQAGFFRVDSAWNTQVGPLIKRNDRLGAWAVSYRFGNTNEFRVGRVLTF